MEALTKMKVETAVMRGVLTLALLLAAAAPAAAEDVQVERLNRVYEAFLTELAPIEVGPATVKLQSPDHSLTMVRHLAQLRRWVAASTGLDLEVRFAGSGKLFADVSMGRIETTFEDDLVVPVQTLRLSAGRVCKTAATATTSPRRSLDREVTVRIESRLGGRLVSVCHQMVLVLVNLDCVELDQAMKNLRVPLPPAGETYFLDYIELSEGERRQIDQYLASSQ